MTDPLPHRIACLCDLRDEHGRVLMLRRSKHPNHGLWSPIGGKLETGTGESPAQAARREIGEEAGADIPIDRLHPLGMISERAFEGRGHWLIFYYRVVGVVPSASVRLGDIGEGELHWIEPGHIPTLDLPETDRRIIWPLVERHSGAGVDGPHGFFSVHIDCTGASGAELAWVVEHSVRAPEGRVTPG